MRKFHAVHFTTVHAATDVRIFHKECISLAENGWKVTVVSAAADRGAEQLPEVDGISVIRIQPATSRWSRMTITMLRMFVCLWRTPADVYHFHDPELIPMGIVLRLVGKKVIYDVHEDVPAAIMCRHWIPSFLRKPVGWLASCFEWLAAVTVNRIICATPHIAGHFPKDKTAIIQNYPVFTDKDRSTGLHLHKNKNPNRIAFVGWISLERGIIQLIDAIGIVNETHSARLVLVGNYHQEIAKQLESLENWKFVDFIGWKTREEVTEVLKTATAGVVTFLPVPNHVESQPNKIFEYMNAGLPVVASNFPLWRDFVGSAGIVVDPEDPEAIANAIKFYLDNPQLAIQAGLIGRELVQRKFNWTIESQTLLSVYDQLVRRH